ncbi:MAG: putative transporter [Cardiobacteriaceae bacterium]|nr:putative transporter [Cardiobacteriaceae bacterium]
MFSSYFKSEKWRIWAYGGLFLIIVSVAIQTYLSLLITYWYKEFYDLLQEASKHSLDEFWAGIRKFLYIAMPYVIIAVLTNFYAKHWIFRWREALTFSYLQRWRNCEKDIEGSSQRIQEDIYRLAQTYEYLGVKFLRAIMTLIVFIGPLWKLSTAVQIPILKSIPGSLVFIAFITSVGGIIISWFVGIKLPKLEYNIQKTEAAFRKELVFAEEDKKNYAKPEKIHTLFETLRTSFYRIYLHYGYFEVWSNSFSQFMVIIPFMLMGTGIFTGAVTLGTLMQASSIFDRVRESFSVFIDNWTKITELRSIYIRLDEFEQNIAYGKYAQNGAKNIP